MSNQSLPPGASAPRDEPPDRRPDRPNRRPSAASPGRSSGRSDGLVRDDREDREDREQELDDRERGSGRGQPAGGSSSSTMALILHALTFLCCANWLFGVLGIVFAVRAAHKRDQGRYREAETLTRYSWYCLGAAAVMFVVMFVLFFWILTQAGSWVEGIVPVTNY